MQLSHVIFYVSDIASSLRFWDEAFGFRTRFLHDEGAYAELSCGDTTLAFAQLDFIRQQGLAVSEPHLTKYLPALELTLQTSDPDEAWHRALAAGAVPVQPPVKKPWGQVVAYVRDPNGWLIALASEMNP